MDIDGWLRETRQSLDLNLRASEKGAAPYVYTAYWWAPFDYLESNLPGGVFDKKIARELFHATMLEF